MPALVRDRCAGTVRSGTEEERRVIIRSVQVSLSCEIQAKVDNLNLPLDVSINP